MSTRSPTPSPTTETRLARREHTKHFKGREYRDFSLDKFLREAPPTVRHVIPDITTKTRIVAVCGAYDDEGGNANPLEDGWFMSDFYAWKQVLKGAGSSQKWVTCENPKDLVGRYHEFLHGSPYYDRKVVLSQAEVEKPGFCDNIILASKSGLLSKFSEVLKEEVSVARKEKQPLVLCIFAHGDWHEDFGFQLGFPKLDFGISDFKRIVGPTDISITVLSTACFSGGWAVYHDFVMGVDTKGKSYKHIGQELDVSFMTAAGPDSVSESFAESVSVGRHCGSYWVAALLKSYRQECDEADAAATAGPSSPSSSVSSPKSVSTEQTTYFKFTEKIYDTLRALDRKASVHEIRFAAQGQDWMAAWSPRSGLPAVDFKKNWDKLETVAPTQDPTNVGNRAIPLNPGELDTSASGKYGSFRDRPGSVELNKNILRTHCEFYLGSFPGASSLSNNTGFHGRARRYLSGDLVQVDAVLEDLHSRVLYRNR